MKKHTLLTIILALAAMLGNAQTRIACIGASITAGHNIEVPAENAYPGQLQSLLGKNYTVMNFGVSGTTMLRKGNNPYWNTDAWQKALKSQPDIVFIDLGANDSKAVNRPFHNELEGDCRAMIQAFKNLPSRPRVIVLLPTAMFTTDPDDIYDPVCRNEVSPRLQKAAYEEKVEVVDMRPLLIDRPGLIPDRIHPEEKGSAIMAKRLFQQITFPIDESFDIFKALDKKGILYEVTNFAGYPCASFTQIGRECKVVKPHKVSAARPWMWRARFWAHEPQADITLLEKGYHLVYCDQAERMANPQNINEWNAFYQLLNDGGLNQRVALEGMSRGAVYVFNWAAANPGKVAAVYVDNPLLDVKAMYVGPNGEEKQDCEINAGKRWLTKHAEEYKWLSPTLLGDDLYSNYPFCKEVLDSGYSFIFTCKDKSHPRLTETVKNSFLEEKVRKEAKL